VHGALFSALLAAFVIGSTFAKSVTAGAVTFVSPCECQSQKSGTRWPAKTDPSPVPLDKSTIQSVTASQIYEWKGPESNVPLTPETDTRIASEQKWYNLTGRVVSVKVEGDGDITLVLQDADGKKAGSVNAEIPVGPTWCELRQTVFGWTTQSFPFSFKESQRLEIREQHVITVTGQAFFDVGHASAGNSNRRIKPKKFAVWEIHPVMALHVDQ
jgi:nitrous oxide reductase accessory protein NosL